MKIILAESEQEVADRLYKNFGFTRSGTDDLFGTPLITMEKKLND